MPRHLIVDGYNVIHAWPDLAPLIHAGRVEDARRALIAALAEYAAASGERVSVVFDAHAREPSTHQPESVDGVAVIFGSRAQSADHVIERRVSIAAQRGAAATVLVATGDRLQRDMVMAMGAAVIGPLALRAEVQAVRAQTGEHAYQRQRAAGHASRLEHSLDAGTRARLERLRRGEPDARTTGAEAGERDEPPPNAGGGSVP